MKAQVEKLTLIPTVGQPLDLTDLTSELNIYQDLNSHFMYCDLVIKDTFGLAHTMPQDENHEFSGGFSGGEILIVQYYSENNPLAEHVFMIYERSDRARQNESIEGYILNGISAEAFESYSKKISRSFGGYSGKKMSTLMESVYYEFLGNSNIDELYAELGNKFSMIFEKGITFDDDDRGVYKFIIPNFSVKETINFMCNETDSKDGIPKFFFYENQDGFFFHNLGSMATAKSVMEFYFTDFNIDNNKDQRRIISYQVKKGTNILENADSGLFKNRLIKLDILTKKKTEKIFDYKEGVERFPKLQPTKQRGDVDSADVNITMMTTREFHDQYPVFADEAPVPKRVDNFVSERRSYTTEIFQNVMSVMIPGTTTLNVGNVVELSFPRKDALRGDTADTKLDRELSGRYIIVKLRNKISDITTSGSFVTVFECVKDTEIIGE